SRCGDSTSALETSSRWVTAQRVLDSICWAKPGFPRMPRSCGGSRPTLHLHSQSPRRRVTDTSVFSYICFAYLECNFNWLWVKLFHPFLESFASLPRRRVSSSWMTTQRRGCCMFVKGETVKAIKECTGRTDRIQEPSEEIATGTIT